MLAHEIFTTVINASPLILRGLGATLAISAGALAIGLVCGALIGLATCAVLRTKFVILLDMYVLLVRGTPVYVQVLIAYYVLPELLGIDLTPAIAGLIALGANCTAYVAEIVRAGVNAVPLGQWNGAQALGYTKMQTARWIVGPQALKNILPTLVNEIVTLVKESSVLSMIGVVELTRVALNLSAKTLEPLTIYLGVSVMYLCVTSCVWWAAKKLECVLEGAS